MGKPICICSNERLFKRREAAREYFRIEITVKHTKTVDLDQVEAEYKIGAPFRHPAIRRIETLLRKRKLFRVTEMGLLMEYVEAPGLDEVPRPSPRAALGIFLQIAEGLEAMHARNVVHADMKPTNVLVGPELVKIIDLGQACEVGTRKTRIQGTPGYIAPEQASRKRITERTDVYNFGATMYWTFARKVIPTVLPPKKFDGPASSTISPDRVARPAPLDGRRRASPRTARRR